MARLIYTPPVATQLVTGGAGAIGSNLVAALLGAGHDVVVLDDLSSGRRELVPEGARLIVGSVTNDEHVREAFAAEPEYVFHLAALFANQNSVEHPMVDLEVNGHGTLRVLEAAVEYGVSKLLYVSSSCVYGDHEVMRESESELRPHTPYAITKLLGERYCSFFGEHHDLDVVSVRLFNAYGPGEFPGQYRNVIPNFFGRALRGEPLQITGTGEETRDFTFNGDTVAGMIGAMDADTKPGDVFNLGSGRETAIVDVAKKINELTGNEGGIEFIPRRSWDNVTRRLSDVSHARSTFGYDPSTPLDDGLARTHEWLTASLA
jgi:nucleoside-diphosphate-sugar epimerase